MSASLQPYLPRLIRYWDEDAPGRLHRVIDGSMVFVDISGFTKMSERLARHGHVGAEEVTQVIDNTFSQLLPEAYAYGANLLKFGGDAMLLLFSDQGHPLRAVAAAHAMRIKLREVGVFNTTAGQVSLRMSVGVHSGDFNFFLVGGSHREFIVAGPSTTQTVAMESAASTGQILLSPATASALPGFCLGRKVGPGYLLSGHPTQVPTSEFRVAASPDADLSQFVPPALRETLLAGSVEPEHRPAAVAFIQYGDFDRLVDDRDSGDAARALDHLVRSVQEAVDSRGVAFLGTDISADGGKVILTAGVPQTGGNDEEQMLLALRDIVSGAKPELPLHVGVNWGHVFSGEVGPPYRRTYTIMGDTVNLAARLMAKAPAGEIYTTVGVLDGSRTTFRVAAPEPFYVKGKKLPIQAFSVGEPEGTRALATTEGLPLIGRDRELGAMIGAWEAATKAAVQVVEISAEPGMGKSRLLQEFLAKSDPPVVVRAECRLYQAATPYFPFRALLRGVWGLEELSPEETEAALADLVGTSAPEQIPWLALIGLPLGLALLESPEVAQLEDQFRQARTQVAIGALLAATLSSPTLMVIEDTHWMDDASRDLLAGLIAGLDRLPWMIALTRRPGPNGFLATEAPWVHRIDLQPLSLDHAQDLIISATDDSPLLPHQVETLARRAEGSPLFLIELLQALRRGGNVEELPHSVEGMIGTRIDKLPPPDRNLLRRVSVLGNGFRFEDAAAVLNENESEVRWQAGALRRLSDFLIIDQTGWVQFQQALIRDVAYGSLPFHTRQALHARVGDSICRAAGDSSDDHAELLSTHYFFAKQWDAAWHFARVAGYRAKNIYANTEAITFFERAVRSAHYLDIVDQDRADVLEALGDVRERTGSFQGAIDAFRQAARYLRGDFVGHADLLLKGARARMRTGGHRAALKETTQAYNRLGGLDTSAAAQARARLTSFRSFVLMSLQRPRETLAAAERAVVEARAVGEQEALARAYTTMDWAQYVLGSPERGTHSLAALSIYESLGDLDSAANVMNNVGAFAYVDGKWPDALAWFTKSQEALRKAGNEVGAAFVATNIGELLVNQGKLGEAESILTEALRVLRAANDLDEAPAAEIQLARVEFARGDHSEAIDRLEGVLNNVLTLGQEFRSYEVILYLAAFRLRRSDAKGALDLIVDLESRAGKDAVALGPRLAWVRAEALNDLGRLEEAKQAVEEGLRDAREQVLLYEEALLRTARIKMATENGIPPNPEDIAASESLLHQLGVQQGFDHL